MIKQMEGIRVLFWRLLEINDTVGTLRPTGSKAIRLSVHLSLKISEAHLLINNVRVNPVATAKKSAT